MALAPEVRDDVPLRVGIFGGTFDPPHLGHIAVAREVGDALALDEILWIPARRSPHKQNEPLTDVEIRLEMACGAIEGEPAFRVCDLEIRRPGPSFTVDTLEELRGEVPSRHRVVPDHWDGPVPRPGHLAKAARDSAESRRLW